mmetsp:Transcript_24691/g.59534  ORF Transcript_24691/g.59534 Transcript_24691/m.59534 type:complete len:231 (+) Transcript_24691:532-1224(+)
MEGYPLHPIVQYQSTDHKELSKVKGVNAPGGMILEGYSRRYQQIDRILRKHVIVQIELEIELPAGTTLGIIAILVRKSQSQLDNFEKIHIAFERFVVKVGRVSFRNRTCDDSGEFRVHCNIGVSFNEFTNDGHFLFRIFFPYIADFQGFTIRRLERITPDGIAVSVSPRRSVRERRARSRLIPPMVRHRTRIAAARGGGASPTVRAAGSEGGAFHTQDAGHGIVCLKECS